MAEALNSLFKAECIRNPIMRPKGGWKNLTDVEIAVAEYGPYPRIVDTGCDYAAVGSVAARRAS